MYLMHGIVTDKIEYFSRRFCFQRLQLSVRYTELYVYWSAAEAADLFVVDFKWAYGENEKLLFLFDKCFKVQQLSI